MRVSRRAGKHDYVVSDLVMMRKSHVVLTCRKLLLLPRLDHHVLAGFPLRDAVQAEVDVALAVGFEARAIVGMALAGAAAAPTVYPKLAVFAAMARLLAHSHETFRVAISSTFAMRMVTWFEGT